MRASSLLLLPVLSELVSAQSVYTIDPNSVSLSTRDTWCKTQKASCSIICFAAANSSHTISNTCDPNTLAYSCICGNNISPNATEYSETMAYYICTEWGSQCVTNCNGSSICQYNCRADHPCGAQNPTRVNVTTTSASASATASNTGSQDGASTDSSGETINTGSGGSAATSGSSSSSGGPAALELGQAYGFFVVVAGIFGGFAVLL